MRAGGGVLIAAGPEVDGMVVTDAFGEHTSLVLADDDGKPERRVLSPADVRHPVFQSFGTTTAALGLAEFRQIADISGGRCRELARFTTGEAALLDCQAGEGRVLVLASDLDNRWNNFPLHATFVPFLHEAIEYLSGHYTSGAGYLIGQVGSDIREPGIVTMPVAGSPSAAARRVAINVDPREADPTRLAVDEFETAIARVGDDVAPAVRVERHDEENRQHLWQYLMAAMLMLLVAEGVVAARTA
jgi:hypothetical protein